MTFYYIPTINYVDTPLFENLGTQNTWFSSRVVGTADVEGFFPPFYEPTLRLSTDDISFNTTSNPVNYMSVEYEGKTYYYFITDISYVSENVVEVSIDLDTIQTYMFDMQFTRGTIERKAIDRWNSDGSINRDYIRENLSTANDKIIYTQKLNSDKHIVWFVIRRDDAHTDFQVNMSIYDENVSIEKFGHQYYCVPFLVDENGKLLHRQSFSVYHSILQTTDSYSAYEGELYLTSIITEGTSNIGAVYFIPYDCFGSYDSETNTETINAFQELNYTRVPAAFESETYYTYYVWTTLKSVSEGFAYTPNVGHSLFSGNLGNMGFDKYYEKNTSKTTPYDVCYSPVLIDETYLKISCRFMGTENPIPLRYLNSDNIRFRLYTDFEHILLVPYNDSNIPFNVLGSYIICNTPQCSLFTDPWKEYLLNNSGSVVTDWISTLMFSGGSMTRNYSLGSGSALLDKLSGEGYSKVPDPTTYSLKNGGENWVDKTGHLYVDHDPNYTIFGGYLTGFKETLLLPAPKKVRERDSIGRFTGRWIYER